MSFHVQCPQHPNGILVEDHRAGDMICTECGLVVGDRVIDVSSEWRTFSDDIGDKDRSRVGGSENPLLDDAGLSTIIGPATGAASFDANGNLAYKKRGRDLSSADQRRLTAFNLLATMCSNLNMPSTIFEKATSLYKVVQDGGYLKGRATEAVASAVLYIACRQENVPRTFKEIVAVSSHSMRDISQCFKRILKFHRLSLDLVSSIDFMSRFCGKLELPAAVQRVAQHIAKAATDYDIVPGKSPITVAAAAIFMASQATSNKRSELEIAEVSGVADSTIKKVYKILNRHAVKLYPKQE